MGVVHAIVNAFLHYIFRPLDHLLFGKDRYSTRLAFLDPVADYFKSARTALNIHGLRLGLALGSRGWHRWHEVSLSHHHGLGRYAVLCQVRRSGALLVRGE